MPAKVKIEVIAGLYCEFLNFLVQNNILLSDIKSTEFGFTAICFAKDYKIIAKSGKKFQCKTKIIKRKGIYFKLRFLLKRKGILIGTVLAIVIMVIFNNIIWRIDVFTPNSDITKNIHSTLYQNDIYVGNIFSLEKNKDVIQKIFMNVDGVGYVTLNFSKGVLTCKVDPTIEKLPYLNSQFSGNITATADGVIEDLRVYQGYSQVKLKQSVSKGDLLVSASAINRNGDLITVLPRAYIKAYCKKTYECEIFFDKNAFVRNGTVETEKTLMLLGKNIKVKKANIDSWQQYERVEIYSPVTFMGFKFPATIETIKYYQKNEVSIKRDEKTALSAAKKVIDTLIESDISLIELETLEHNAEKTDNSIKLFCTVYGYYDITK